MKYLKICLLLTFLYSCSADENKPEVFAKKFCDCSEKLSEAIPDKKANKINDKEFEKIILENRECMGPNDPRSSLNPDELEKFEKIFKAEIQKNCPQIAKSYGSSQ